MQPTVSVNVNFLPLIGALLTMQMFKPDSLKLKPMPLNKTNILIAIVALLVIAIIVQLVLRYNRLKGINTTLAAHNQNLQHELEVMEETLASDVGTVNHVTDREPTPKDNLQVLVNEEQLPTLGGSLFYKALVRVWDHRNQDYFVDIISTKNEAEKYLLSWDGEAWRIEPFDAPEPSFVLDNSLYSKDLSKKIAKFIKDNGRINHDK